MSATGKTEPTLEGFRDFCAGKPADERYSPTEAHHCALTQYVRTIDRRVLVTDFDHYRAYRGWWPFRRIIEVRIGNLLSPAMQGEPVFGALTDRLTARLRSQVAK